MKKYLSVSQAAEIIGVSTETLRRWDKSGKFKSTRNPINNYRVYSEDQVNSLVEEMQLEMDYTQTIKRYPKAFLKTSYGELYNLDVNDFFNLIKDNSVDLIFADPPYNIKKAEWDTFKSQKDYVDWSMAWIKQAHRVLKDSGSLFICGFSEILADLKWAAAPLFKGCKWLVWYYRNKANLGNDWGRSHESILHFRKSKDYIFNIDEVRIPYNNHTIKYPKRTQAESSQYSRKNSKKDYTWEPNPLGAKPKDVLEIPTISNGAWERYNHKTQKPVELLRKIILSSSNTDSFILDPFGGSGTTYAVAEAYKRNWKGNEINKKYCEIIQGRLLDKDHIRRIAGSKDEYASQKRRKKLRG
jgi:site-specific DNA-methyltransferase (adenine-specific)